MRERREAYVGGEREHAGGVLAHGGAGRVEDIAEGGGDAERDEGLHGQLRVRNQREATSFFGSSSTSGIVIDSVDSAVGSVAGAAGSVAGAAGSVAGAAGSVAGAAAAAAAVGVEDWASSSIFFF